MYSTFYIVSTRVVYILFLRELTRCDRCAPRSPLHLVAAGETPGHLAALKQMLDRDVLLRDPDAAKSWRARTALIATIQGYRYRIPLILAVNILAVNFSLPPLCSIKRCVIHVYSIKKYFSFCILSYARPSCLFRFEALIDVPVSEISEPPAPKSTVASTLAKPPLLTRSATKSRRALALIVTC